MKTFMVQIQNFDICLLLYKIMCLWKWHVHYKYSKHIWKKMKLTYWKHVYFKVYWRKYIFLHVFLFFYLNFDILRVSWGDLYETFINKCIWIAQQRMKMLINRYIFHFEGQFSYEYFIVIFSNLVLSRYAVVLVTSRCPH